MQHWDLLTTHWEALSIVAKQRSITTSEMASVVGITRSKVRRVMVDLFADGYVSKNRNGSESSYQIVPNVLPGDERRREIKVLEYLQSLLEMKSR